MPDDTDDTTDTTPPCQGDLLPPDAQPPPPFQYDGQTVNAVFDPNQQQWGFWSKKKWTPLYKSGC